MTTKLELDHPHIPVFLRRLPERWVVQSGHHVLSTVMGTFPSYYQAMLYQRKLQGKPPPAKVEDFKIYDYGMDSASCFPGDSSPGLAGLQIGVGDNPIEALDDALEVIAQGDSDIDLEDLESRIKGAFPAFTRKAEDLPSATQHVLDQWKEENHYEDLEGAEETLQNHDWHYYIGIGWNLPSTSGDEVKL